MLTSKKGKMNFKKTVEKLLDDNERSLSWLGRKLGKSPQNMQAYLKTNNPKMTFLKEVAAVFEMDETEFINIKIKD